MAARKRRSFWAARAKPSGSKIWEPMWQCSPSSSMPGCADAAAKAELLVLVGSGDELVGVGVHAGRQPQHDLGLLAPALCDVSNPDQLAEAVHHNPAQLHVQRTVDLKVGLVVAVQGDVCAGNAGLCRDRELTAGGSIQPEALFFDPAHHGGAQERLAGIVDVHTPADIGKRIVERVAEGACPGAEIILAHDEQRGSVLLLELADRNAADGEFT
jgi:hypothetical protein